MKQMKQKDIIQNFITRISHRRNNINTNNMFSKFGSQVAEPTKRRNKSHYYATIIVIKSVYNASN